MSVKQLIAGKHSCVGHLSASDPGQGDEHSLERPAMLVYCGAFSSMDGPVEIEEEHLDKLIASHNEKLDRLTKMSADDHQVSRSMPPLQLDHSTSAAMTVGRVVGRLKKGEFKLEDGSTVPALFAERVRVLGRENVEKVKDGRWANLSIGADLDGGTLNELSITPFPAAPNATLLARAKALSKGETMHEKLKKYLMEQQKLGEEDAEKLAAKMGEKLRKMHEADGDGDDDDKMSKHLADMDDEKLSKLADDVKEEEKKLAAEETEETEKKAKEEKMAAARGKIVSMAKGFRKDIGSVQLAQKKLDIGSKLTRLRAMGKLTPAEQKKTDVASLAKLSTDALAAVLKAYEDREPVVDARIHGTTRAVNLAKLAADSKKAQEKARLEHETRIQMGLPVDEKLARLAEAPAPAAKMADDASKDEHLSKLGEMLGEHEQKDAILAHVKAMLEGQQPGQEAHEDGQLSALVENVTKLQTQFQDLLQLVGEVSGIGSSELTD